MSKLPVSIVLDVAWGEMDALGHVNNIVYLRYFESARIEYFLKLGLPVPRVGQTGPGPILATSHCEYRRPLVYPDRVRVECGCGRIGKSSFTLAYRCSSETHGFVAAEGETVVVYFDYEAGKSVPIPEDLRSRLVELG